MTALPPDNSRHMPAPSGGARVDVAGVLRELLAAEQCGAVHFLAASDPYVSRAAADLRRMLQGIVQTNLRHEGDLAQLLEDLGNNPPVPRVNPEHQYMAFLSSDYVLPGLIKDKARSIAEYQRAIEQLGASDEMAGTLRAHLAEHRRDVEELTAAIERRRSASAKIHP